jgi:V8-like Glu-specific endopeptidase
MRDLDAPTSGQRANAERYQEGKDRPELRVSRSSMLETHLGGTLEPVSGFEPRTAMTHGFKSTLITSGMHLSLGGEAAPFDRKEQSKASASDRGYVAESRFGVDQPWTQIADTSVVPWRCVCHLEITYGSGRKALGSGWLSGPDTVITAGHNVFSAEGDGWATEIRVVPGRNSNLAPFDETYARQIDALPGWVSSQGREREFDLGVIKTGDASIGHRTGWFGYAVFKDSDLTSSVLIQSAGYPAVGKPFATQWYDAGRVTDFDTDFLAYRIDTEPGQSGSPVFFSNKEGQRWVVATHVYGRNSANLGRRITDQIFNVIAAWTG